MADSAQQAVSILASRHETIATAESLTAGAVSSALAAVPGASAVLLGGVVAYSAQVKIDQLGVRAATLADHGAVSEAVAVEMAERVRERFGAAYGLATTGVAGPTPHDGSPVGLVVVAVSGLAPGSTQCRRLQLAGGRARIRAGSVDAALALLLECLRQDVATHRQIEGAAREVDR